MLEKQGILKKQLHKTKTNLCCLAQQIKGVVLLLSPVAITEKSALQK